MKTEISSWLRCLSICAAIVYAAPKVNTGRIEYELQELRYIHKEARTPCSVSSPSYHTIIFFNKFASLYLHSPFLWYITPYHTALKMKSSTSISISTPLYKAAKKFADEQHRTFSAQLEVWIAEKLAPTKRRIRQTQLAKP